MITDKCVSNDEFQQLAQELRGQDWADPKIKKIILENIGVIDYIHAEGYWANSKEDVLSPYPFPKEKTFKKEDSEIFLPKLQMVEDAIKDKKLPGATFMQMMGHSSCRCCKAANGASEYIYNGCKWPQGYIHYLKVHEVAPTPSFVIFINEIYEKLNMVKAVGMKKSR